MILLLDPFEYLLYLFGEEKSFSNKLAVDALLNIYDELFETSDDLLNLIDKIILVNTLGMHIEITPDVYRDFLRSIKKRSKKAKYIFALFNDATIKNFFKPEEIFSFLYYLDGEKKDFEFVFLDNLLTNNTASLLSRCTNVTGYRLVLEDNKKNWEEIVRVNDYLFIALILYFKFLEIMYDEDYYTTMLKGHHLSNIKELKSLILSNETSHHLFMFQEKEFVDQEIFIKAVLKEIGSFYIHNCKIDGIRLPNAQKQLIVLEFDKLSESDRHRFLNEITSGTYKDRAVIIIIECPISIEGFPNIKIWGGISSDSISSALKSFFKMSDRRIEILNNKIDEFKYVITSISSSHKETKRLLKRLDDYSVGGYYYYTEAVDFWHNLETFEIDFDQTLEETGKNYAEEYLSKTDIIQYQIDLDEVKNVWLIEKNGILIGEIPYTRSKGIKYIVYLAKHYRDKTISDTDLRRIIDKWQGKSNKKAEVSTDAKKIRQDLKYLFEKQCPELAPLNDCIKISSKDPGCHFRIVDYISLEIVYEEIPDPIY
jgi:hypothetical protein